MTRILRRTLNSGPVSSVRRGIRRLFRKHARLLAIALVFSLLVTSLPAAASSTQSVYLKKTVPAQQSPSLAVQLYSTVSKTVTSIGSWMASFVATKPASTYQPVAAYITPAPPFIDAPTNLSVTAASSTSINLSWTAPSGTIDHYVVERSQSRQGPFFFLANVTGATTKNDTTVTNLNAYLYRVRAVSNTGAVSSPSNMALGTAITFQFSSLVGQQIRAQHFHDVRTAINAVRPLANLPAEIWDRANLLGLLVEANDVNEMRTALNDALTSLSIPVTAYEDPTLSVGVTLIKGIHIEQLQTRSTRGSSTSSGPIDSDSSTARLDPLNATGGDGENPLSRNFNWSLPLLSLRGRAGMNLGLTLSYNSLVWTKVGSNAIAFDGDNGFPGPGFRVAFPVIQQRYFNSEVGKQAYLLISPDGSRTELRQVGTSNFYEAADSSHMLLDESAMILRTTDGTQMTYVMQLEDFKCTQIKDRNGNFISVSYDTSGQPKTVTDTLGRIITFGYENGQLMSIKQLWKAGVTHFWARFEYADLPLDINFGSMAVHGATDNSQITVLSKVTLADDSRYEFSYTSWGQVWKVTNFAADNSVLNYRTYDLPQTAALVHDDCPRFTVRKDWAKYWNGDTDGTTSASEEVATATFIVPVSDSWTMPDNTAATGMRAQVTSPDGTLNKLYFVGTAGTDSGWKRGLAALVETHSGGTLKRKVMTTWTQDDDTNPFILNPRVKETNTYDPEGNRARREIDYGDSFSLGNGMSCHLPRVVIEYAANASTKLRSNRTTYNMTAPYTDRRILGLVHIRELFEGDVTGTLKSKWEFFYDNENGSSSIQGTDAPVQHDNTYYTASFVTGRGNLSSVKRHNVEITQSTTSRIKYNTAGAVVSTKDASDHETTISYADAFSDGAPRNTLAYPTKVTDPDIFETTTKYDFDFGAVTSKRTPKPNEIINKPEGERPEQVFTYDSIGRLEEITNSVNAASTRLVYSPAQNRVDTYKAIQQGKGEAQSFEITDGHGRIVGRASEHPSATVGNFSGAKLVYDAMGRLFKQSNPTETAAEGHAPQWTAVGDDLTGGWIYTEQTYDWNGRPLVTTKPSITSNPAQTSTKSISYEGCGCAGGVVTTLTDEVGRKQKIYSDILGRGVKTEVLNWNGTVYSTTVNTYNVRDQVTEIKQYEGSEGSSTNQVTAMTFDGFGRLSTRHRPEQHVGTSTVWTYNADDSVNSITDARGASQTFVHNGRHLITNINYSAGGSGVPTPAPVTFTYDAAGNRLSMLDGMGSKFYEYDLLSRLTEETRLLGVGTFGITYEYNLAGQLNSVTDPFGAKISYTRNVQGQLETVTGTPYAGTTNYITGITYRAWGAAKSINYPAFNATIAFNARMQPTEYRGAMSENYSYYSDGRLASLTDLHDTAGTNPPMSLRFLSRGFNYDHVGRVTSGFGTGNAGQGVPFSQGYSYDVFGNMTGRFSAYYNYNFSLPTSDTATFVNNRRTNWAYNFEGQVTSTPFTSTDSPRTLTYDAAGRMVTSVENGPNNTVTYSASYDGDGNVVFESSVTSPGASESSYIVRSTVLGGEVLTRLDQSGNKKITHVPAEGLLFATQRSSGAPGPFVHFIWRNPLGISETNNAVYDPLGNYIPFRAHPDPRPPAGSYSSASMSGLYASQANPDSSAVGCIMDGLPTNCNRVMQAIGRDQAKSVTIHGLALSPFIMRLMASFIPVTYTRTLRLEEGGGISDTITPGGDTGNFEGGYSHNYASWVITRFVFAPGLQSSFEPNPQEPVIPLPNIEDSLKALVKGDCDSFVKKLLAQVAKTTNNEVLPGSIPDLLKDVTIDFSQQYKSDGTTKVAGRAYPRDADGKAKLGVSPVESKYMTDYGIRRNTYAYVLTVLHELIHLAGSKGRYTDRQLAEAINAAGLLPKGQEKSYKAWYDQIKPDSDENSTFFDSVLQEHCPGPTK